MEAQIGDPLLLILLGTVAMLVLAIGVIGIAVRAHRQRVQLAHRHEVEFLNYSLNLRAQTQTRLEAEVAARTAELQAAQQTLLEQEKLHALGLLLRNVGHELNSPLGAIQSSSRTLEQRLNRLADQLELARGAATHELSDFFAEAEARLRGLSRGQLHAHTEAIAAHLRSLGYPKADTWASDLVQLGFAPDYVCVPDCPLLRQGAEGLELAITLGQLYRSLRNLTEANLRAQGVVQHFKRLSAQRHAARTEWQTVASALRTGRELLAPVHQALVRLPEGPYPPAHVRADRDLFAQLWYQLFRNALEATSYKQPVVVTRSYTKPTLTVTVTDSGPGIPAEVLPRVTEAFFTTRTEGGNLGMGLYLARQVVKDLNGQLDIETSPRGTTVKVQLPVAEAAAEV